MSGAAGQALGTLMGATGQAAQQVGSSIRQQRTMRGLQDLQPQGEHGTAEFLSLYQRSQLGLIQSIDLTSSVHPTLPTLGGSGGTGTITEKQGWRTTTRSVPVGYYDVYTADAHIVTVAKNGAGKSMAVLAPNLVWLRNSAFITDKEGEICNLTAAWREHEFGPVYPIDPMGIATAIPASRRCGYNPLMYVRGSPSPEATCMMLAQSLVPEQPGEKSPFFTFTARSLYASCIAFVAMDATIPQNRRHLGTVYEILTASWHDRWAGFQSMATSDVEMARTGGIRMLSRMGTPAKPITKDDILETALANTTFLSIPAIRDSLSRSDVDFTTFHRRPGQTAYLCVPGSLTEILAPWVRLVMTSAFAAIEAQGLAPHGTAPIRFYLDEFNSLGNFTRLMEQYTRSRGFAIQFWLFCQNLGQLRQNFGENWETFLENAGVVQAFGGNSGFTAEYLCKQLGNRTIVTGSQNRSTVWNLQSGPSAGYTESLMAQPLMTSDQMAVMPRHDQLLIHKGVGPAITRLLFLHEHMPWFLQWAASNRLQERPALNAPTVRLQAPAPVLASPIAASPVEDVPALPKRSIRCPRDGTRMNVPSDRGKIRVTCPGCSHVFNWSPA